MTDLDYTIKKEVLENIGDTIMYLGTLKQAHVTLQPNRCRRLILASITIHIPS
jgi:hypothetical protein